MSRKPEVSVVMSVYNGARYLRASLESILAQQGVECEVVVVDDGSTDASAGILAELAARDPRLRVIRQANTGLTRALIRGCAAARGELIARQDADDLSLPDRLKLQAARLREDPALSFVSCWTEVMGPRDELLLVHTRSADADEASAELRDGLVGPPGHGSVMFRRSAYEAVGGYRSEFYFAQDMDLWLRLVGVGRLAYLPQVLYRYRVEAGSISGSSQPEKIPFYALVKACHAARLSGGDEALLLASGVGPPAGARSRGPAHRGATDYFIGRCLLARRDRRAVEYFARCLRTRPLHWRAWLSLAAAIPLPAHPGRGRK